MNWKEHITIDPNQYERRPYIRGMRIRIIDVLDLLATGLSHEQILEEMPNWKKKILRHRFAAPAVGFD